MSNKNLSYSEEKKWVHFVGVCGSAMGSLATALSQSGFQITGSDRSFFDPMKSVLEESEVLIQNKFSKKNLKGETWGLSSLYPDVVVVGNAISRDNEEAQALEALLNKKALIQKLSFPEALAIWGIQDRESLVLSGTHGKTTTSTMAVHSLQSLGLDPAYLIGGIPLNSKKSCQLKTSGKTFVCEGDEYDTAYWAKHSKFLYYKASWVVCTGVEFDHADIFSSIEDILEMFYQLIEKTSRGWILIDEESSLNPESTEKIAKKLTSSGLSLLRYGFSSRSDVQIQDWSYESLPWSLGERGILATIKVNSIGQGKIYLPFSGKHNLLNFASIIAFLTATQKIDSFSQLQEIAKTYLGVKRRQENFHKNDSTLFVDDFAHHPSAIRETLQGLKSLYPERSLQVFFEPASATSGRNIHFNDFLSAFDESNSLFVFNKIKKNIPEDERLNVDLLCEKLKEKNPNKSYFSEENVDQLFSQYKKHLESNHDKKNLTVLMSNSSFSGLKEMMKGL